MSSDKNSPALSKPSDLENSSWTARPDAPEPVLQRGEHGLAVDQTGAVRRVDIPGCLEMRLHGGELVRLTQDQVFYDKVVIRAGERGKALYPSSQAASWVVHFSRVGPKVRVIPESLLEVIED